MQIETGISNPKYTELLDNNRDESMEEAFPELFNLMYKSNR